jgi:hypothetical protein
MASRHTESTDMLGFMSAPGCRLPNNETCDFNVYRRKGQRLVVIGQRPAILDTPTRGVARTVGMAKRYR